MPSLTMLASSEVPAMIDCPTSTCFQATRHAVGIQADSRLMQERRAVIAAANVVLPRPHGFHRRARGLGDLHRFSDKVRGRVGPPTKTAAEKLGMDLHLLGFEPGDFPGDHLIQGLELGAGPDLAFVLGDSSPCN